MRGTATSHRLLSVSLSGIILTWTFAVCSFAFAEGGKAYPVGEELVPLDKVVVLSVGNADAGTLSMVDLDTGQVFDAPKAAASGATTEEWMRKSGVDAVGKTNIDVRGLACFDMKVTKRLSDDVWGAHAYRALYEVESVARTDVGVMSGADGMPATYGFETREGSKGALRIEAMERGAIRFSYILISHKERMDSGARLEAPPESGPTEDTIVYGGNKSSDGNGGGVWNWAIQQPIPVGLVLGWYVVSDGDVTESGGATNVALTGEADGWAEVDLDISREGDALVFEERKTVHDLYGGDTEPKSSVTKWRIACPEDAKVCYGGVAMHRLPGDGDCVPLLEADIVKDQVVIESIVYAANPVRAGAGDVRFAPAKKVRTGPYTIEGAKACEFYPSEEYMQVGEFLYGGGSRAEAAEKMREAATREKSVVARAAEEEMAGMLERMAEEDAVFKEPADLSALTVEEQVRYHVYKIREITTQPYSVSGLCNVFYDESEAKPAEALARIGEDAVPMLMALLDDDRPTRAYSSGTNGKHIFRHSDAALQILEKIAGMHFDWPRGRGTYLANADRAIRRIIVTNVANWRQSSKGQRKRE